MFWEQENLGWHKRNLGEHHPRMPPVATGLNLMLTRLTPVETLIDAKQELATPSF